MQIHAYTYIGMFVKVSMGREICNYLWQNEAPPLYTLLGWHFWTGNSDDLLLFESYVDLILVCV